MIQKIPSVLIVANEDATGLLSELLADQNYRLSRLLGDDQVFNVVEKDQPDLVLIDLEDSVDRAIEICRGLKKKSETRGVPVIIFYALPEIQDKERAFQAGCFDFITKPFSFSEVIVRIEHCLLNQQYLKRLEKMVDERNSQLKVSEARFRNIFISLSVGGIICEAVDDGDDFVVIDFNPAAERIEKISKRQVVGKRVTEIFAGIEAFGLLDIFRQVWRTGKPQSFPVHFYRDDRIRGWRENYVFKLPSGEVVSVYSDETDHKKVQDEIIRNRDFLQKIIDGVRAGIIVINRDFSVALANRAAFEYTEKQKLDKGVTCHQFLHGLAEPCRETERVCPLIKVFKTRQPEKIENLQIDSKGRCRIVERSCFPVFDDRKEVHQVIQLTRDVTEIRQQDLLKNVRMRLSELALTCSSKKLEHAFLDEIEQITQSRIGFVAGVSESDRTLEIRSWSSQALKTVAGGRNIHYPLDERRIRSVCIEQKQPLMRNEMPDGEEITIGFETGITVVRELIVPVFSNDRVVALIGVANKSKVYTDHDQHAVQSLSERAWEMIARKQAEENSFASEEKFSKMFMASPDAVCLIRVSDRRILDVNASFENMFGYPKKELLNATLVSLNLWQESGLIEHLLVPLESGKTVRDYQSVARRTGGEVFDISLSCETVFIDEKHCLILIVRDISERKTAEKERKMLENQLQQSQKMESIGTLAGGIAHDFNNILSGIIGYTQLAMAGLDHKSKSFKRLNDALKASDRAKDLVSQILMFSRKEAGKLKPMNIQVIVKEALKLIRSSFPSTIRIEQYIEKDCGLVMADITKIHQVTMNICTNAYHAMREKGGVLTVSLKQVRLYHEDIQKMFYLKPGTFLELAISDTGVGISNSVKDRIFEPYFTTKKKDEGTGLGLAVVHGIVKRLDGEITVESTPGSGTTFRVYLPVVDAPESLPKKESDRRSIPTGKERVLFVDDDKTLVEINKLLIEKFGYTVTAKTSSLEAFRIFQNAPDGFDLVITDVTMPDMTGDVLAEKILAVRPDIPILMITGYSERITAEQAKAKGIKGYLAKPVLQRELAREIRRLLDES